LSPKDKIFPVPGQAGRSFSLDEAEKELGGPFGYFL
jgi:hypothetical protein